ncbi:hypothetical protein [Acidianus ambivalens]|uniref:hypothetical protein n=1 Tax=Acidianus ambivalens TaxID=2283 RepID=UPI00128ED6E1|nr:hypothetical protein [Acidianus ambivalens]
MLSSSPFDERDTGCSSLSPIKPSIELGRSVVSVTNETFDKEVFKLFIRGLSIPALKGEAFRPLNPQLCKVTGASDLDLALVVKNLKKDEVSKILLDIHSMVPEEISEIIDLKRGKRRRLP